MKVWLDGEIVPIERARVSPLDRAFQLGDGIFETLRAYDGRPFGLAEHLARLARGASITGIALPESDLARAVEDVLAANALDRAGVDASVRITLSAGEGGSGASRKGATRGVAVVTGQPVAVAAERYERGISVVVSRVSRRAPPEVLDPRVKALSYLPHVLARRDAEARGADDALLLGMAGDVVEATTANVFVAAAGALATPPTSAGCLDGVTRDRVIALARAEGLRVVERRLTAADVALADEVFLTASVSEIVPVVRVDGLPVGDSRPGPVARALLARYRALARSR